MPYPLFDEASFARMVSIERRRTDRSGRPFLLLLFDFRIRPWDGQRQRRALLKTLIPALTVCTRQTDIAGWYKHDAALGIIFTELRQVEPATQIIVEKMHAALQSCLTPAERDAITVTAHVYSHQDNGALLSLTPDRLYPDLKRKSSARMVKRILDILGSIGLLVLLAPLLVWIGVAIKLTSRGPILFKQTRLGQYGKPFTFLKFRSMYTDADPNVHKAYVKDFIHLSRNGDSGLEALKQDGLFKLNGDPRVTAIGHVLRKSSLDELPQLLNVLKGDMSLVGPRPPIPYEAECYAPWHKRRVLEARPGVTGLWQVHGRSRTTFDDMVRLDLRYINQWSMWTDVKLLLQTPGVVMKGEGAR